MKIFHVISTLNIGGAECFVKNLANEQAKTHDISIVILKHNSEQKLTYASQLSNTVHVIQLDWKKKYSLLQLFELIALFRKLRPDVVHVHLHNPFYYVYLASYFFSKIRFIHTVHNTLIVWDRILKKVNLLRFLNNKTTHVCLSDSIYQDALRKYPQLNLSMIYNGIPAYSRSRTENEIKAIWDQIDPQLITTRFLAIGNIGYQKNYPFLCRVFKRVEEMKLKASLVIVGEDRDPEKKITKEIEQIGCTNVLLAGPLQNAPDFLLLADAMVMGSLFEGMPMVVIEAFSLGKPLISTPAGGVVDMVKEGRNGFLLEDWSIEKFANKIQEFISLTAEDRAALSSKAHASFIDSYLISKICDQYLAIYHKRND